MEHHRTGGFIVCLRMHRALQRLNIIETFAAKGVFDWQTFALTHASTKTEPR